MHIGLSISVTWTAQLQMSANVSLLDVLPTLTLFGVRHPFSGSVSDSHAAKTNLTPNEREPQSPYMAI